jgi:hypothetical protein
MSWEAADDHAHLQQLRELVEAGIPYIHREVRWMELTGATYLMYGGASPGDTPPEKLQELADKGYQKYLQMGLPQTSDANKQLQEDGFHLASWESASPVIVEALDFHLRRIKKAQNVCAALIAYQESGICYCESLLVLSFFLMLPQGFAEEKEELNKTVAYMSESSAFWLLITLVTSGAYKDYYGRARIPQRTMNPDEAGMMSSGEPLCVGSGAMEDINLLECCLAYHEPELWMFMNRLGFQLPTVFYGAFMRLYATYLPTASVFRFWDILFTFATEEKYCFVYISTR